MSWHGEILPPEYEVELPFWTEEGKQEKYDKNAKRFRAEREDVIQLVEDGTEKNTITKIWTSTEVKYGKETHHVMVLDCDSEANMIAALRYLFLKKIGCCAVQSSEGHYWVVTDRVGTLAEVMAVMKRVPGADSAHVEISNHKRFISIRAHSREWKLPVFPDNYHRLTNPVSIKWMEELKSYFGEIDIAQQIGFLRRVHKTGAILKIAADSSFEI